jgi:hypothetical protein
MPSPINGFMDDPEKQLLLIIVDEADTMLIDNEPLRAVINSGWTRGSGAGHHQDRELKVPEEFFAFARITPSHL